MNKKTKQQAASKNKTDQAPCMAKRKYFIPLFIIVLVTFVVFFPVLRNGFVNLDDDKYILNNPTLASMNLKQIFSGFVEGNYHPLTMLTYSIEYYFFGLHPNGYHAVNLLLHLLNVILVFYVVLFVSDKTGVALVASSLFGIHPLHVESVAWASELKDLLYAFFFLASLLCYQRYQKEPKTKFYFYSLLLFLLALFSKAMAVSLPIIFLLSAYYQGKKINVKRWLELLPFFAFSLLFGMLAIVAQKSSNSIQNLDFFPFHQRLVFACYGFMSYLFKLVAPFHLSAFYPYPIKSTASDAIPGLYYLYPVLFLVFIASVFYSLRFSKKIFFGVALFAITLFLVLQLLPVGGAIMADRYSYIPSMGIFFLAGEGCVWLWSKYRSLNFRLPLTVVSMALLVLFSSQTYSRCNIWKNGMTLWNDVINKEPSVALAYNNRAALWVDEKKYGEALSDYSKAIEIRPQYADAYQNRGVILAGLNNYEEALSDYNKAITLKPGFVKAYNNRGMLQMNFQKYQEALGDYNKAIELDAGFSIAYNNRGNLFLNWQKYEQAFKDYSKAIELDPKDAKAFNGLGVLLMRQQKNEEAIFNYSKAIVLQPNYGEAYCNKAIAQYNSGKREDACRTLEKAAALGVQQANDLLKQWCR